MKLRFVSLAIAAVLAFAAASFNVPVHAQVNDLAIIGSSAQYYEAAQADVIYGGKSCFFIDDTSSDSNVQDTRGMSPDNVSLTDHDKFWLAWTPGTGGSCAESAVTTSTHYDFYMNADSVIGLRCFFASPSCQVTLPNTGTFACGTDAPTGTSCSETSLPSSLEFTNVPINVAATDIRPEDGLFATTRALTPCGTPMATGSQYLGIGDQTGSANQGNAIAGSQATVAGYTLLGSSFNVGNFSLYGNDPASGNSIANGTGNNWEVFQVGAAPELVIVNPSNSAGLGSLAVSNINRNTLAGFVDGTFGAVSDIFPQTFSTSPAEVPVNTILREYLSGTYNTFEYAIPNSIELQTSQEVGLAAVSAATNGYAFPADYCSTTETVTNSKVSGPVWGLQGSTTPAAPYNPLALSEKHGNQPSSAPATRNRAIGTGNVVKEVENVKDSLGYAFWSEANFSSASPGSVKYLTVDGVDPIEEVWQDGEVPTPTNDLESNVSFSHVKDGSYAIWSILRMVTSTKTGACNSPSGAVTCSSLISTLTGNETKFVTPDTPDFVLKDQLSVVRSHFTPPYPTWVSSPPYPGNSGSPCNGDIASGLTESGGDVGGFVYSIQADNDANGDEGNGCGVLGRRQ